MKIEESDKTDITTVIEEKFANEILNDTSKPKFQRNCPKCGNIQKYIHRRSLMDSIRYNWVCNTCKYVIRKEKSLLKRSMHSFTRNCPKCNSTLIYKNSWSLNRAIKKIGLCKKCVFIDRPISESQKECLRQRIGINNPMFGRKASVSTKFRMSLAKKGKPGKPLTEETKHKLRLYRSKWVNDFAGGPQYNPTACKYFDNLNKQTGWNLQHAENGGEFYIRGLGYFLDAYDKERNIVVEYDEPRHFTFDGHLKQKDVIRQQRITEHLSCQFYRYNELTKNLESTGQIPIYKTT